MSFHILNPGSGSGQANSIQELFTDPVSPDPEEVWVLRTGTSGIPDGTCIGMFGLGLTYINNAGSFTYQLSYQTLEGPIVRVALS